METECCAPGGARTVVHFTLRRRASRPQLKRDPLGGCTHRRRARPCAETSNVCGSPTASPLITSCTTRRCNSSARSVAFTRRQANEAAFNAAVRDVAAAGRVLFHSLHVRG